MPDQTPMLENGIDHEFFEFVVALNHKLSEVKLFPESMVVRAHYLFDKVTRKWLFFKKHEQIERTVDLQVIPLSAAEEFGDFSKLVFKVKWDLSYNAIELGYWGKNGSSEEFISITGLMTADFKAVFYQKVNAKESDSNASGRMAVRTCHSAIGKWAIAHEFVKYEDAPIIYLWRSEIPAHFEIHSHIQSSHCATFPSAWVQVWLKLQLKTYGILFPTWLKPGYEMQDTIGSSNIALGEGGEIGSNPTSEIAIICRRQFLDSMFFSVFPFQSKQADLICCLMPMDLEYMHFLGYFGIPIVQTKKCTETVSKVDLDVMWFCWNSRWEFETNNKKTYEVIDEGSRTVEIPPLYSDPPNSERGEVWCYMEKNDRLKFEPFDTEIESYNNVLVNSKAKKKADSEPEVQRADFLPFFKFDPRRYTAAAQAYSGKPRRPLSVALNAPIQSSGNDAVWQFAGFKIYTATGWAPEDPFLKSELTQFYDQAILHNIPIINHGGPAGFFTHDREHYYDLMDQHGKIVDGNVNSEAEDWVTKFSREALGPDGKWFVPKTTAEKRWWFVHHYVSPRAWKKLISRPKYKKLKICIAHFGDSDHLSDKQGSLRARREPGPINNNLRFGYDSTGILPNRTHQFIADLLDLIDENNRVYVDLSYVILDESTKEVFQSVFDWAREFKPVVLERILWGTDWPLPATESPVKGKEGTMFWRYANGFRNAIPKMPGDFFFRACFLNPIQFLGLKDLKSKLQNIPSPPEWSWLEDIDARIFDPDFSGDKLEVFYKTNKKLAKQMEG